MKKKFIQILMLLIAAVSVGSFVSCKDTSEDLYNELRTQALTENASLKEALNAYEQKLNDQIALYTRLEQELNAVKKDSLSKITAELGRQADLIAQLQADLDGKADQADLDALRALVDSLKNQISGEGGIVINLQNLIENDAAQDALIATLQSEISDLKSWKEKLEQWCDNNNFADVLDWMNKLQQEMTEAKDKINAAIAKAEEAKGVADSALELARLAYESAQTANAIANEAKTNAAIAQTTADSAKELATTANATANDALNKATEALTLARANKEAIDALTQLVNANKTQIDINTNDIAKNSEAIAKLIEDVAKNSEQISELNNTVSVLSEQVKKALDDASQALAQSTVNMNDITYLKTYVENLKELIDKLQNADSDTNDQLADILDRLCCLDAQLATMEATVGLLTTANIVYLAEAKCYADQQIALLKDWVLDQIKVELTDYLKKDDIDLTKYVTKEEIANYVTKAEAANYATKAELEKLTEKFGQYTTTENLNKLLEALKAEMTSAMTEADAALKVALLNLIDEKISELDIASIRERIKANEVDIEWLKNQLSDLSGKMDGFISREEFESWKDQIHGEITQIGNQQGNTNIAEFLNGWTLTITTDLTKTLNEKLAELKEELKSEITADIAKTLVDDYHFITEDDITGLAEALALLETYKDKLAALDGYEERIKALEDKILDLAGLEAKVNLLESTAITMDDLADYIKAEDVAKLLNDYVKKDDLSGYATLAALDEYAKKSELAGYATKDDLNGYASKDDIKDFVTLNDVKKYLEDNGYGSPDLSKFLTLEKFAEEKADILSKISANTTEINKIKSTLETVTSDISTMKSDISTLQTDVQTVKDDLDKLEKKMNEELDKIKSDVTALQNKLAKQVTGITIQHTVNPMFGSFNIPAGIQSNVLLAYYGVPFNDIEFPTYKTGNYGERADQAFTSEEIDLLKEMGLEVFEAAANMPLLAEDGNAGKVYMTINPNTADLDGLKLSIVNSLDKEAPIKLKPIKKSDEKLMWGYTRADNGFYEADAYVDAKTVMNSSNNGIVLTREEIKEAFKDIKEKITEVVKSKDTNLPMSDLAIDIYSVIRDMKAEKSGLKCTYTTTEADATETEHSVYSEYSLLSTFLNPLNLNTGKDFNFKTMPGYEAVVNLFNKLASKAKDKVHTAFNELNSSDLIKKIVNLKIVEVKLKDLDPDMVAKFEITVGDEVTIDGLTYHMVLGAGTNVPVKYAPGLKVNGTTVGIPSEYLINPSNPEVTTATLVINGNVTSGTDGVVPMQLVIPVKNDADTKYVWYDMSEVSDFVAELTPDNVIVIDGTNVARFTGSSFTSLATSINLSKMIDLSSGTTPTLKLEFTYDLRDEMQTIWGYTQDAVASVNDMIQDIKSILDEFNDTLAKINSYEGKINSEIDNVVDNYLMKYLDKINNTVVGFVNSFNRRLQPFMVASTSKGFKQVSAFKEYPTVLSSDVTLYPTTRTLELIAPIARKHVAVTNVFSDDLSKSVQAGTLSKSLMSAVNTGDLNKVFDGNKRMIEASGMEKNYVYEVAYSVLDFDGNMATHRYYIKIQ